MKKLLASGVEAIRADSWAPLLPGRHRAPHWSDGGQTGAGVARAEPPRETGGSML